MTFEELPSEDYKPTERNARWHKQEVHKEDKDVVLRAWVVKFNIHPPLHRERMARPQEGNDCV